MPLFQVDIEKSALGERWTNRYHVEAADLSTAVGMGQGIVNFEKTFHLGTVAFNTLRVRSAVEGDELYNITPLTGTGARAGAVNVMLPLFNVVRVDIAAPTGRPSRKYYRGILIEDDQAAGALDPVTAALVEDAWVALLESGTLKDVDGQTLLTPSVPLRVGMRQLRRGSKRKTQPILTGP